MSKTFLAHPHHPIRLGDILQQELSNVKWTNFRAAVAFAKRSGTQYIAASLASFGGTTSISVGIDHAGTSLEALQELLKATENNGELFIYKNKSNTFHPKIYLFHNQTHALIIIGSGNLTKGGLYKNSEAGVVLELDLGQHSDQAFYNDVMDTLQLWSKPTANLCLVADPSLLLSLNASGDLPTEAQANAVAQAGKHVNATATSKPVTSPFSSFSVPSAPPVPLTPSALPGTSPSKTPAPTPLPTSAKQPAAVAAPVVASHSVTPPAPLQAPVSGTIPVQSPATPAALVQMSAPQTLKTFGMTLQNTDVGFGQVTPGKQARSPEVFIPLRALDLKPTFWHWIDAFTPDLAKYKPDPKHANKHKAWIAMQLSNKNRKPRPLDKLDWEDVPVTLNGTKLLMHFGFNPVKKDIRVRHAQLRAAGNVNDILLIRQLPVSGPNKYDISIVKTTDPNYSFYDAKLKIKISNSPKRIGYF